MAEKTIMTGWKRLHKIQETARMLMLSGILIHNNENIYYFTSVYPHEPSFLIIPPHSEPKLITARSIYAEAEKTSLIPVVPGDLDIAETVYQNMLNTGVIKPPPATALKSFIRKIAEQPLGIEQNYLSVFLFERFNIRNHVDITPYIMGLRSKKDSFEIDHIKSACETADQAMLEAKKHIRPGMSEKELSGIFDAEAKIRGADETKCRVRSGRNSALAFSRWMDAQLAPGPLLIDYGARIKGYWSDITRMFYLGSQPDAKFLEIYELVLNARNKALEVMNPGQSLYGPETVLREIFRNKGYEQNMIYTAGHGIGLEIHEPPILTLCAARSTEPENKHSRGKSMFNYFFSDKDDDHIFKKGQIYALEPGIYLEEMGVRIEDMVHITQTPTLLSSLPTEVGDIVINY
ncbi:MAG: Xaa-Pro peptidase family protein [Desulfonatronovibrio sp.]